MPGYKLPCRYCDNIIPPESSVCPFCGKVNPVGPLRCHKCHSPIQKDWKVCSSCGLSLEIPCPKCQKTTFFGDYCQFCDSQLVVTCPNPKCQTVQPPIGNKCIKCGNPLK